MDEQFNSKLNKALTKLSKQSLKERKAIFALRLYISHSSYSERFGLCSNENAFVYTHAFICIYWKKIPLFIRV